MDSLDQLFARRKVWAPWYRGRNLVGAVLVHVIFVVAAVVAPKLLAEKPQPLDFVPVRIVPAATLGQIAPPPAPAPRPPEPVEAPPEEETKPAPVEAAPEPARKPPPRMPAAKPRPQAAPPRPAPKPAELSRPASTEPQRRLGSPRGNPLAAGGPAQVSGFDDPDFTYSYYADLIAAKIREQWSRPPLGDDVQMAITFRIREDGSVTDVKIADSSGYNSFDRAGLRAVQTATLPPLPKSYRKKSLGVRLVIR